jgi:hypothetical protein
MFRAALLMASGEGTDDEIEALLLDSIERWRAFESTWMELRSVLLLGRHALVTGRKADARTRLADLYASFTEGFQLKRLLDAKALLAQLAG